MRTRVSCYDVKRDALTSRLESLATDQQREFASGRELLDSIASNLKAMRRGLMSVPY